ncbi:MAG TPA: phospholipase D family protein [Thermoanaerobaculia bacterium]|nr:phospholipase D family protein [Thermoanaerobaculia bacterium]
MAGFLLLDRCNALPSIANRTSSHVLAETRGTRLERAVTPLLLTHPGLSGIHAIRDARDAFAARCLLASAAERTLDVQYYIWRNDLSGTLLMKALLDAADRGVRVRLLLDDNNTAGLDAAIAAIDSHPRIEVRLFNPFVIRKPRLAGYLTDFSRLNRRMHNKSFTADNQATVVGGRNVGDEYFGATDGVLFADLDVIGIGPVVNEVSSDFDRYWASESSYPVDRLLPSARPEAIRELAAKAARVAREPAAVAYVNAVHESAFVHDLIARTLPLEWATARLVSDPPAKALGRARRDELLTRQFGRIFGTPHKNVDLVSPYFVPGERGVELFRGWRKQGVAVRVLTNALEATDVAVVHAGYARRRRDLLAAGVTLYELRSGAPAAKPVRMSGSFGSSGSSLHAKTFAVDGARLFVGSFNFDPRSAELNTEMGFVIDSPQLARGMTNVFDKDVPPNAFEVELHDGEPEWIERRGSAVVRHRTEPGTSFWTRLGVTLLSWLPIEPLL